MIYCVWYPSGGFGHFVNAVLSIYGDNFVRPVGSLKFSINGNSHNLDLVVPKYSHEHWPGGVKFCDDKNYCVLIDNGINSESTKFKSTFPDAKVLKICYTDLYWPVVARTMIDKAMKSSIEDQLPLNHWHSDEPWAKREKYFLFLRDHALRSAWKPASEQAVNLGDMLNYNTFFQALNSVVPIAPFEQLWFQWREANAKYIDPVHTAQLIVDKVRNNQASNIAYINDIWTQAVIYYYIWLAFGVEVPHNDFANFFTNTAEITKLLS